MTLLLTVPLLWTLLTTPTHHVPLHVALIRHAPLSTADLELAHQVATSLLQSAGIDIDWQDSDGLEQCQCPTGRVASIDVRLIPLVRPGRGDVCGEVVVDTHNRLPVVLIHLPAIDEEVRRFRLGPLGRSNPSLSTLQRGDLIGLTIAHEIGHALGLPHAARGLMKADFDEDDILALRQSRLTFLHDEQASMHVALASVGHELDGQAAAHSR